MKESSKCRSCRAFDRITGTRPSARGGKMPQSFAEDERVAAEDNGDVVIPAAEGAALEVVESELAFEVFIDALGAPSFLGDPNELLATRGFAQPRERVVRRRFLVVRPFDQEPVLTAIGVSSVHLDHRESRHQSPAASLAPQGRTERTARGVPRERVDGRWQRRVARGFRYTRDDCRGVHADGVIEVEPSKAGAKLADVAVGRVGESYTLGQPLRDSGSHHLQSDLPLRAEHHFRRDLRFPAAASVARPRLGHVQLHVDRRVLGRCTQRQTYGNLAVGDLTNRTGVLPLNPRRLAPLLQEPRVVDHPRADALTRFHRMHHMARHELSDGPVLPLRLADEVQKVVVRTLRRLGALHCRRRKRLDALTLVLPEDSHRVESERGATTLLPQKTPDFPEVILQPTDARCVQLVAHAPESHAWGQMEKIPAVVLSSSCIGNEYLCGGAKAVSSCPATCIGYCTASTTQLSDSGILSAYSCFYPPLTVAEAHAQCSTILGPGEWHPCGADAN